MLRNENFLGDCGTFASNAFTTGNSNALGDVLGENYDMIREFFQTETDAFICSATMTYLDDVSDQAKEHSVPEGLKDASLPEKRQWFYEQVYSLLDSFVMDSVDSLKDESQDEEEVVKCCDPSCSRTFKYRKCRTCMSRPHTIYLLTQKRVWGGGDKQGKKNRAKIKAYSVFTPIDRSCIILVRICEIRV